MREALNHAAARIQPGQVVRSLAGRDSGRMLVAPRVEEDYAWVADGCLRPIERPKKKKLRHLGATRRTVEEPVRSDRELRRLLARLETDEEEE